jgi:hypothetical protein
MASTISKAARFPLDEYAKVEAAMAARGTKCPL